MGNTQNAKTRRPKVIVFDLNYTLWSAKIRYHEATPFKKQQDGLVVDSDGRPVTYFDQVPDILELLQKEGYTMAVASRTEWPEEDRLLLQLFEFDDYFKYKEIYFGCKTEHMKSIHLKSRVKYEDMLFFDDSQTNVRAVSELGVTSVHVREGMTFDVIREGFEKFGGLSPPLPVSLASPGPTTSKDPTLNSSEPKTNRKRYNFHLHHILKSYKLYKSYSTLK